MNDKQVAQELVKLAKALVSGCEKLPEGPMRDNCEKKKKEKGDKEEKRKAAMRVNFDPEDASEQLWQLMLDIKSEVAEMEKYATKQSGGMPSDYSRKWRMYKSIIEDAVKAISRVPV